MRGQDEVMRAGGYVTAREVADATGYALSTIHRAIEGGRIPGGQVGPAWYIDIFEYAAQFPPTGPSGAIRQKLDELKKHVKGPAKEKIPATARPRRSARSPR